MTLFDELFKINVACREPVYVRYRKHPRHLKIIGLLHHDWRTGEKTENAIKREGLDRIICTYYID